MVSSGIEWYNSPWKMDKAVRTGELTSQFVNNKTKNSVSITKLIWDGGGYQEWCSSAGCVSSFYSGISLPL